MLNSTINHHIYESLPENIEQHLNHIAQLLVPKFLVSDCENSFLETPFPCHELGLPSEPRCKYIVDIITHLKHTNSTQDLWRKNRALIKPTSKTVTHLVHQGNALVTCFHQVLLCIHNDFASIVIQWQEQTNDSKADETRFSKEFVQEQGPNDDLDRRVYAPP